MRALRIASVLTFVGLVAVPGCKGKPARGTGRTVEGRPVETQSPNAGDQEPAFAGQTRAPFRTEQVAFTTEVVASGLEHPWSVAFLPDGEMLVTERPGRLRIVGRDGALSAPVEGLPEVDARDQGGLLEVALDPRFADNHAIYVSFAEREGDKNGTALARGTLVRESGGAARLDDVKVIWRQRPKLDSTMHFGGRIVFDKDGTLYLTLGERSIDEGRHQAQRLDSALGKIIRIRTDGSIPDDNPLAENPHALPEIWSVGHRNVQAAALNPQTGELWIVDHGARGGDEVNIVKRGEDYGWPTISYGIEYAGDKITDGITQKDGMEQPVYYWDPVIAPSGAVFYTGDKFPRWKGSLFVGGLAGKHIARLTVERDRVVGEERLLAERGKRIRDVRQAPDGFIYVLTDEDQGELLRLVPP
ncbi:MAG TPA: PQQ-dependent sugar dehydrogenase [Kofleriaceae bacterium]|nr:PQQ-dependent sugar dehydrogenase [Kofleriaceae bacterium]